ncbi:Hypothetical protein R9X50_00263800 [Acrodontium crateriforme]|uniref:Xylanolytic transcriptional activator regulatory domain-containing protein n=1 Tax=Acrodontium crateriforme TaxID=150365 RepID=A0AAQ3R971_9PEZI|nr:Hypothetical protein R9X50_00263800 [Acrodontium crateriforme]
MENKQRSAKRVRRESSTGNSPQLARELGLMRRRSDQHESVSFVGSASGIHFVQSVYNAAANESPGAIKSPDQDTVPGEDDQLPPSLVNRGANKLWKASEILESDEFSFERTGSGLFESLLEWSQSFWDNWHPAYPFLHAPTVLEWFQKVSEVGIPNIESCLDGHKIAILRSIMSISLADRRSCDEETKLEKVPHQLVFNSFSKAIESVQSTLVNPPDMEALQSLVTVELFLISILRHNAASRLGGLIVRMAFQMGLHRCPARYPTFTAQERELRQRLFWTIYCIDRHICHSLGSPLTIRDDDIDVCYFEKEVHIADATQSQVLDDRLAMLNLLGRHAEIKGQILELCHKSINHRKAEHDQANVINGSIIKWSNDIEQFLDNYATDSQPLSPAHQIVLTVLKHECIIALERPLLTGPNDPRYNNAIASCVSSARSIIKSLSMDDWNARLALLWPSMTWAVWMSAFVMLFAAIKEEITRSSAIRCADQSIEILDRLSLRGSVWPSACAAAIRDLCKRLNHDIPVAHDAQHDVDREIKPMNESVRQRNNQPALEGTLGDPQGQQQANINTVGQPFNGNFAFNDMPPTLVPSHSAFDVRDIDLFDGFDLPLPFYLGNDQYAAWMP